MQRYLFIRDNSFGPFTSTVREIAKLIDDEIISPFLKPSRISTKTEKACLDQMVKLIKKYETLKKIPNNRLSKTKPKPKQEIQQFLYTTQMSF